MGYGFSPVKDWLRTVFPTPPYLLNKNIYHSIDRADLRFLRRIDVSHDNIVDDLGDMRIVHDDMTDDELTESIKDIGVQDPIQIREHPTILMKYQLVDGRRRNRCSIAAGKLSIPAEVWAMTDLEAFHVALARNIHRDEPDAIGLGYWLTKIRDEDPKIKTQTDLASAVKKSQPWVSRQLKAYELALEGMKKEEGVEESDVNFETLLNSDLTERQARAIRKADNTIRERVIDITNMMGEPPSARAIERMMKATATPEEVLREYSSDNRNYDDAFVSFQLMEKAGMLALAAQKMVETWRRGDLDWQREERVKGSTIGKDPVKRSDKEVQMYMKLSEVYPTELIDLVDEIAPAKTYDTMAKYCRRLTRKLLLSADRELIQTALEDFRGI